LAKPDERDGREEQKRRSSSFESASERERETEEEMEERGTHKKKVGHAEPQKENF